jgi:hypothetical protein
MRAPRILAGVAAALALAGCGTVSDQTPASQISTEVMTGRWILAAPNAPTCGLNVSGDPGVKQGSLVPDGGCPETFYLSKVWTLDGNVLTISDDSGGVLGQFTFANGIFAGTSAVGAPVTLTRQPVP